MTASPESGNAARPRRSTERVPAYVWCFLGSLTFNMFSGYSDELGFPLGPDRILFAIGAALLLLDPAAWRSRIFRWRTVHVLMLAIVALAAWSAATHGTLLQSLGGFALLDRLIVPFFLFTIAPVLFATTVRRDLFIKVLTLMGLYLGVTATLEMTAPQLVFPRYIADPDLGIHFGRARGPFLESVALGAVLGQCAFVAGLAFTRLGPWWRRLAGASILFAVAGVVLTLTRSVWLGTAVGILVVGLVNPRLRRLLPRLCVAAAVVVLAAIIAVPGLLGLLQGRATTERSVWDRTNTNWAAVRVLEEHPWTGVGWLEFVNHSADYVWQADDYPITNIALEVHNVPLGRAAELGLPGAALWIACLLLGPVRSALRRQSGAEMENWRLAFLGGLACWFLPAMLSPLPYALPNTLMWLMGGLLIRRWPDPSPKLAISQVMGRQAAS